MNEGKCLTCYLTLIMTEFETDYDGITSLLLDVHNIHYYTSNMLLYTIIQIIELFVLVCSILASSGRTTKILSMEKIAVGSKIYLNSQSMEVLFKCIK